MKFNDLEDAFLFVSSAGYGENAAILCKMTGEIFYRSIYGDVDEGFPDDEFDPAIYVHIPHKNDLDLGATLVFEFVEDYLPGEYEHIERIFRKRGAYPRFKDLLDRKGLLEQWYEFEDERVKYALLEWCRAHDIHIPESAA